MRLLARQGVKIPRGNNPPKKSSDDEMMTLTERK